MVTCENCEKSFYESEQSKYMIHLQKCAHYICRNCYIRQIKKEYFKQNGKLSCKIRGCNEPYMDQDYLAGLGQIKYNNLQKNLEKRLQNKQNPQFNKSNEKLLQVFNQLNQFLFLRSCKYCDQKIVLINKQLPAHLQNICNEIECQQKLQLACFKKLECGHHCCGIKNEKYCMPCLNKYCLMKGESEQSELCAICQCETLQNSPCVQLKCKHIYHYNCVKKLISFKQARINFNNYMCPLCKAQMELPEECDLQQILEEKKILYNKVQKLAIQRLEYDKRDQDKCLQNQRDKFYKNPIQYALSIYSYFICYKCNEPYFGGIKSCEDMLEGDEEEKFNEKELICSKCSFIEKLYNCPQHGTQFLEYKCKFCCSVASYFCWGNTHFCERCHYKQNNGDFIAEYPKEQLPKCPGKEKCPLKIDHKPNGKESCFCFACLLYPEKNNIINQ